MAFHDAVKAGRKSIVELLLKHGVSPTDADEDGQTPLSKAAEFGHVALIKLFISLGADIGRVDTKSEYGRTALECAIEAKELAAVKALLELGANPNISGDGDPLLSVAIDCEEWKLVQMLLDHGARMRYGEDSDIGPPVTEPTCSRQHLADQRSRLLLWAASRNNSWCVEKLLNEGVNIDVRNQVTGDTPLLCAIGSPPRRLGYYCDERENQAAKLLIIRGGNIDITNHHGRTALPSLFHWQSAAATQQ
jgi:ankyrin repeat protein